MIIYMTDEQRSLDQPELVFPRWIRVECTRVIPWDYVGGTVIRLCGKEIGEFYHISKFLTITMTNSYGLISYTSTMIIYSYENFLKK